MITTSRINGRQAILRACVLGFCVLGLTDLASAEQPEGIVRTFAFVYDPQAPVDFLSENSQLVVVARQGETDALTFATDAGESEESELLDGTTWVFRDAIHVFQGGQAPEGAFLWLIDEDTPEPPPTGAVAITGKGSVNILSQESFSIALCGPTCGFGNETSYYVPPYGSAANFVVVTAAFNR